jgi:ABC-2 type transport system ATP-binding protein
MIYTDRIEINVTRHCQNKCAACNHGSPWAKPYFMQPEILRLDLSELKPILHTKTLCLQGGEPLLHKGICDLMDVIGASGIADRYSILTNGKELYRMTDVFYQKCASLKMGENQFELRVTAYPNLNLNLLDLPTRKAKEYGFVFQVNPKSDYWKLFKQQPDDGREIWRTCYARECHTLHEGWFYHCPLSCFFPKQFFGWDEHIDGISLSGITEISLAKFLLQKEPPKTCARCAGGPGIAIPWHESKTFEEWMEAATV